MLSLKARLTLITGTVGGYILTVLLGDWTPSLTTLVIFMAIDFLSGLSVAGFFKKSPKTETGGLESKTGRKGLVRKIMTFVYVLIGNQLDLLMASDYIKNAICVAFIINELISITENAGLMGVPMPKIITQAIDLLKRKEEES